MNELRQACRSLLRSPGFSLTVIGTLALGIGASLTIFSLVRAALWRPLPYPEPDRIVSIQVDARNRLNAGATPGEVHDLKERSRSFDHVAMLDSGDATLTYQGEMEHVTAARVSDDLLPLFGSHPSLGRTLESRIHQGKQQAFAVLISDDLWRRRFAADPAAVGKSVRIDDAEMQIAGVLPSGFRLFLPPSVLGAEQIDVWLPYELSATRQYRGIPIVARLRAGVSLAQANAELQILAAMFEKEHPDFYFGDKGWQASPSDRGAAAKLRLTARRLQDDLTHEARPALLLLAVAVGFVLLIACVNVANLMLARGAARRRELDIRRALGAGRSRIVRQLLIESLLLAAIAAGIGLLLAQFGLAAVTHVSASHIPLQSRAEVNASEALFALLLAAVTSMLFGVLPAWRLASVETAHSLHAGRMETHGSGARRLQRVLVAAEVALSVVPLACGGLMLRSFRNLMDVPLGFQPAEIITAQAPFSIERYPRTEQQWALLQDVLNRVRLLPGVRSVSAANPLPLAPNQELRRVGRVDQPDAPPILATQQGAVPGYLDVMNTPLLAGRDFTNADVAAQRNVVIIDERLAKLLWPEGAAIGKRLAVYRTGWRSDLEVIGVTSAVRATRVRDEHVPHFMMPSVEMSLVIKTSATAAQIGPGIQSAVAEAHTGRAAFEIRPMSAYVANSIGDTRFILLVLAAFAASSVLLAAVGLYSTLAYLTAQRTREFGIRMALGSSMRALAAIVIRESSLLVIVGITLGLAGAIGASSAIRGLLYRVQPLDGVTLAGTAGLVAVVALIAAGAPAWRAARVDPVRALKD